MVTHLKLEAAWEEVKERLKEVNYELTDDDLEYEPGAASLLLERLSIKLQRTPEEIRQWIESVSYNNGIAS